MTNQEIKVNGFNSFSPCTVLICLWNTNDNESVVNVVAIEPQLDTGVTEDEINKAYQTLAEQMVMWMSGKSAFHGYLSYNAKNAVDFVKSYMNKEVDKPNFYKFIFSNKPRHMGFTPRQLVLAEIGEQGKTTILKVIEPW